LSKPQVGTATVSGRLLRSLILKSNLEAEYAIRAHIREQGLDTDLPFKKLHEDGRFLDVTYAGHMLPCYDHSDMD
jgi:hypothetical protein